MNVSLYQAAAALDGGMRWQQTISDNLATGAIHGFKKSDISFSAVQAGLMQPGSNPETGQGQHFILPSPSIGPNFVDGELEATGNKTDIAISGPGFLAVEAPNQQTAYTRDGELKISGQGQLTTKEGFPVLGDNGPITVDPRSPDPIAIATDGEISQGGINRGRLRLSEFRDRTKLLPMGGGYYQIQDGQNKEEEAIPSPGSSVSQGFLESSNVKPAVEMGNLIMALRHFEANQKVIQSQDDRMGRTITELSATS